MENECPIHGVEDDCANTRSDIFRCPICHILAIDMDETDERGRRICIKCAAARDEQQGFTWGYR